MKKRYIVRLTSAERESLTQLVRRERVSVLKRMRASILLKADDDQTDQEIADDLEVGLVTVERVRKRCIERGVEAWSSRLKTTLRARATSMGSPRQSWCRSHVVRRHRNGRAGPSRCWRTTRRVGGLRQREHQHDPARSKKNEFKPWLVKRFCIPPENNAAFPRAFKAARPPHCPPESSLPRQDRAWGAQGADTVRFTSDVSDPAACGGVGTAVGFCFGAVGSNCDGVWKVAPCSTNGDATVVCQVSVGSQMHDTCCSRNPGGQNCGGSGNPSNYPLNCSSEWSRAQNDTTTTRQFPRTFDPTVPSYGPGSNRSTATPTGLHQDASRRFNA